MPADGPHTFRVQIHYREPTFEQRTYPRDEPFRWTYEIVAGDANEARTQALSRFRQMALLSGVGWMRQVVEVLIDDGGPRK